MVVFSVGNVLGFIFYYGVQLWPKFKEYYLNFRLKNVSFMALVQIYGINSFVTISVLYVNGYYNFKLKNLRLRTCALIFSMK